MIGTVGVAPGTTTIQLPTGQVIMVADWIDDKLYSTVQFTNGQTTPIEAFSVTRSQAIPGGTRPTTRVDTNIIRTGDTGLPPSWEMLVYGFGTEVVRACRAATGATQPQLADATGSLSDPPTLRTLFNIDRVTYLQFFYQKAYTEGVMKDYPRGAGYSVFSTNMVFELAQNGIPSPRDRVALVLPIPMREGLAFKMTLSPDATIVVSQDASDGGTALTFADVKITLWGLIKRNVS